MKNFKENFNFITNILILFILFFGGLSYADTNGIWQFANDTRGGTFGGDEQGFTSNYTFINPVYFNLGLHITGFSTFTQLNGNLFYANNVTIANQLTLTGFNCGVNFKLRTDGIGNVICMPDNVNDGDFVIGNEYPLAGNGISITGGRTVNANDISATNEIQVLSKLGSTISLNNGGGSVIDADTFITTQTCPAGQILRSVGKNSKICVTDTLNSVKNGVSWAEVSGKPVGFADNVDNVGITTETDPQVRTVTNGKWCKGVAAGKIDCTSAAPSSGPSINYGDQVIVDNGGTGNWLLCPQGYVSRGFWAAYHHFKMYCVRSN